MATARQKTIVVETLTHKEAKRRNIPAAEKPDPHTVIASRRRSNPEPHHVIAPTVYMMASRRNGTLYTGVTSDLARRAHEHRTGLLPGFTMQYRCHLLVWAEQSGSSPAWSPPSPDQRTTPNEEHPLFRGADAAQAPLIVSARGNPARGRVRSLMGSRSSPGEFAARGSRISREGIPKAGQWRGAGQSPAYLAAASDSAPSLATCPPPFSRRWTTPRQCPPRPRR
ncbi:MAG: GIY-YIG nuclease family protein [Acetobacteraceae bacterium]